MKTIKLYKKFKKYEYGTPDVAEGLEGGLTGKQKFSQGGLTGKQKFSQGVGYANAGLQVANMGMQMFGDQGNEFGVKDDGSAIAGGALSGAAQGASMGSMGGPIATAIGAGVGGIYGGIKAYQGNEEAKARQEEFESQQRQLSIKESQNKWQQTLASGFKPQGNEFATKYAKYGGLMKMGNGGKLKPAKIYTDKAEFLKAKEAYNDSLYLHNRSNSIVKELEKQGFNKSEKSGINEQFNKEDLEDLKNFVPKDKRYYENKDSTRTILTGVDDKFKGINTKKEIPFVSKMVFHKNILPDSVQTMSYKDPYTYKGGKQSHETLEEWQTNNGKEVEGSRRVTKDLKTLSDTSTISYNTEEDALLYKKPNQPVKFVPNTPLPIRQTLMKPPTKKVERAPGLGGFNRIMKNGGNVQQLSKDAVEFKGNSHEMGGIKEPVVNGRVLEGAEVEDEETMQGNFIFSEELGFAQRHKPLAKMLGKLEKKAQSNPNDKVNNSTIARVNSRINSLKKEQEETKESLGIENDLGEMKNGGLYKKMGGGGKYVNDGTNQSYTDASGTYVITGKNNTLRYKGLRDKDFRTINDPNGIAAINKLNPSFQYTPSAVQTPPLKRMESSEALGEFGNYQKSLTDPGRVNVDDTTMMLPEGSTSKTKVNWGNLASGLAPYVGVAANYMVNEQAKKLRLPQEKLTTPISLQRVNYDNQRAEADIQRGQLNKITNRNLTNSAVASAVMAQNLGTTIRQKNAINESEMNTNRLIGNEEVGKNKSIEQYNNTTQVGNEDRFYNRDRDYLQNKGQIATNLSQMVQQQRADKMKYDLEDRKIEAISKADAGRDVWYRKFLEDQKKANATHALTSTEEVPAEKKYGGKVKSTLRKKVGC